MCGNSFSKSIILDIRLENAVNCQNIMTRVVGLTLTIGIQDLYG